MVLSCYYYQQGVRIYKMKSYISKHPIVSCLGISIIFVLIILIPLKSIYLEIAGLEELTLKAGYLIGFVQRILGFCICVYMIRKLNYTDVLKFGISSGPKVIYLVWPAVILIFFNMPYDLLLSGKYSADVSLILPLVLRYTGVGLIEESFFRGLILAILLSAWGINKKGIYRSVIVSSILFGLVHLTNLFNILKGKDVMIETISQVFYVTFLGIFFAAIYLRTKNLWIAVIIHSLFDIADGLYAIAIKTGGISSITNTLTAVSITDEVLNAVLGIPFALFGIFILRKVVIKDESKHQNLVTKKPLQL